MASKQQKNRARAVTEKAIKKGELAKLSCQKCGKKAEVHHLDYFQPLKILWLCKKHHTEWHKKNKVKRYKIPKIAEIKVHLQMVRYDLIEMLQNKGYSEKDISEVLNINNRIIRGILDEMS